MTIELNCFKLWFSKIVAFFNTVPKDTTGSDEVEQYRKDVEDLW